MICTAASWGCGRRDYRLYSWSCVQFPDFQWIAIFLFSLLSHKRHMITEICFSGKAGKDDFSIQIPLRGDSDDDNVFWGGGFTGSTHHYSESVVDFIFSMAVMFSDIASLSTLTAVVASRFFMDIYTFIWASTLSSVIPSARLSSSR